MSNSRRLRSFALSFPYGCTQHAKAACRNLTRLITNRDRYWWIKRCARYSVIWFGSLLPCWHGRCTGTDAPDNALESNPAEAKVSGLTPDRPELPLVVVSIVDQFEDLFGGIQFQTCSRVNHMNSCIVRPYTPNNWEQVAPLLAAWSYKPLARHDGWPSSALLDFSRERVRKVLGDENGGTWMVSQQDHVRGFLRFSMLPSDSEQLRMRTAQIDYLVAEGTYNEQRQMKETLVEQTLFEIRDSGVWYLGMNVDASDLSSLHALEAAGFVTVTGLLTFALDLALEPPVAPTHPFNVRLATAADADQVATMARAVHPYDRFRSDPFISDDLTDDLHATRARNACCSGGTNAVLIAEDHSGVLGFALCSLQPDTTQRLGKTVGTIAMLGSAEQVRRQGVGYVTALAALQWFREQGCQIVEVESQLRNIAGWRLFQKCGFGLVGSSVWLRRLL